MYTIYLWLFFLSMGFCLRLQFKEILNISIDVDKKWEMLYRYILEILDEQSAVKTFIFSKSKPEWLVAELAEIMNTDKG